MISISVILLYIFGAFLRLLLSYEPYSNIISERVEVSTPINSWKRVKEGVYLHEQGIPVYSGGVFHETPLCLFIGGFLLRSWNEYLNIIFIVCDLLTAALLGSVAVAYGKQLLIHQNAEVSKYSEESSAFCLKASMLKENVAYVIAAYLFSPYTIASCVAHTTTVFANFLLALSLAAMMNGKPFIFGCLVACATYQSIYPASLLVPGILYFKKYLNILKILVSFIVSLATLLYTSLEISGNWDFIESTYGFILSAPDLTPNIGLFWYFFTEMFEHFRLFFLATFQINAFIYVFPLAIRLHKDPVLLSMALLSLQTVFRSYPSLGDVGFYMALLPLWRHLYSYLRQTFLVGCMLIVTSVLGPVMYNLWIFNGSANTNFYFAVTLAFNTAQIFLVTDLLFGYVKREYHLYHGLKMEINGEKAKLALE